MSCKEMMLAMEKRMKRKLSKEEKIKIMKGAGHSEEEILEELDELIYA